MNMNLYIHVLSLLTGLPTVHADISQLDSKFVSLRVATRQELEKAEVSVSSLLDTLYDLPTAKKSQHREFLMKYEKHFENCRSIEGVFRKLNTYWNYLNMDILAHLITEFSLQCLYSQLRVYEEELEHFMERTTLMEYYEVEADHQKIKPPEGFIELVSEHNWEPPIYLKEVDEFRRRFAHQYDLHTCVVILVSMGIGMRIGMGYAYHEEKMEESRQSGLPQEVEEEHLRGEQHDCVQSLVPTMAISVFIPFTNSLTFLAI